MKVTPLPPERPLPSSPLVCPQKPVFIKKYNLVRLNFMDMAQIQNDHFEKFVR